MSDREEGAGAQPDQERTRLLRSAMVSSSLDAVAEAVAVASEDDRALYVDRDPAGWRWSLTSRGGPYPLLRNVARFLRCDYRHIQVAYRTLDDGLCVLCRDPEEQRDGLVWALLELDGPTSPSAAAELIQDALGPYPRPSG